MVYHFRREKKREEEERRRKEVEEEEEEEGYGDYLCMEYYGFVGISMDCYDFVWNSMGFV